MGAPLHIRYFKHFPEIHARVIKDNYLNLLSTTIYMVSKKRKERSKGWLRKMIAWDTEAKTLNKITYYALVKSYREKGSKWPKQKVTMLTKEQYLALKKLETKQTKRRRK